jgi:hypothetical protein
MVITILKHAGSIILGCWPNFLKMLNLIGCDVDLDLLKYWFDLVIVKDRYGEPERGSEWEPIKILLEGEGGSNKTNTASNTRLRLTTQIGQVHVATGVLLNLGTNFQPHRPENAAEHQTSSPLTNTGQTG